MALEELRPFTTELRVLGTYPRGGEMTPHPLSPSPIAHPSPGRGGT